MSARAVRVDIGEEGGVSMTTMDSRRFDGRVRLGQ